MKTQDFNKVVEEQLKLSTDTLVKKEGEYATVADRLSQFKKVAKLRGTSQLDAVGGMMVKHTTSVYELIEAGDVANLPMWEEKITDHINYLLLLKAVVVDERDSKTTGSTEEAAIG